MNRQDALKKIKKCLALAASPNPHEAAAAMRQAQKMMAEHAVTDVDLSLADVCESLIKAQHRCPTTWEACLADMVAEVFGCETYAKHMLVPRAGSVRTGLSYAFVGVGSAAELAGYAYQVLARQCANARRAHIAKQPKACKAITKTARGDEFALGWVIGVERLLERFSGAERNRELLAQYMRRTYPNMEQKDVKDRAKGRNVTHNDRRKGFHAAGDARLDRGLDAAQERRALS